MSLGFDVQKYPITTEQKDQLGQANENQVEQLANLIAQVVRFGQPEINEAAESFSLSNPDVKVPVQLYESDRSSTGTLLTQSLWLGDNILMEPLTKWMNKIFHLVPVTATAAAAIAVGDQLRPPALVLRFYVSVTNSALSDADKLWYTEARDRQSNICEQRMKRRNSEAHAKQPRGPHPK